LSATNVATANGAAGHHGHHEGLAHHFESYEQQKQSSFLGMWLFLVQEVLFFGGLFVTYAVYRTLYGHAFVVGSHELSVPIGAFNTGVLLLSSFTMVVAVAGAQRGNRKMIVWGLILTILFGCTFLGVKWFFEYTPKWEHGLFPGPGFEWHGPEVGKGVEIFFSLYFAMTGMHALHMVVGIGIMLVMIPLAWRGKWTPQNYNFVEGFGLYWHFVDIVWIFLFPFLYLIGLSSG
jgi:cytochrome c oxidase subunit 3